MCNDLLFKTSSTVFADSPGYFLCCWNLYCSSTTSIFCQKKVFKTKNVLLCLSLVRGNALGCRRTWKSSVVFTLDVTHPSDTTPSSATPTDLLADFILYSFVFPLYNLLHSILLPASVLLLSTAAGVFLHWQKCSVLYLCGCNHAGQQSCKTPWEQKVQQCKLWLAGPCGSKYMYFKRNIKRACPGYRAAREMQLNF